MACIVNNPLIEAKPINPKTALQNGQRLLNSDLPPSSRPTAAIAADCRHYHGDRPCIHNRLCGGCRHYEPYTRRICVIKLGALGDVIRTLCILPELRERFPNGQVTWVTMPNGCRMLKNHPAIDRLMEFNELTWPQLAQEEFDTLISLDKEPQPCALAMALPARNKLGIGLSRHGTPVPLNEEAQAYFQLGLSDELKFRRNTKSYPQLIYEALGWKYRGQRYELPVDIAARGRVRLKLASLGWIAGRPTLGINVGAGQVFANKTWPVAQIVELIAQLNKRFSAMQIVLLGGPREGTIVRQIVAQLRSEGIHRDVIDTGTEHDEQSFVALVEACDVVFSGDTMAMHVAIALKKGVVAFFGPTCEQEIDLFGQGEKLVARVPCGPCYKRVCDHNDRCVYDMSMPEAVSAIGRVFEKVGSYELSVSRVAALKAG